VEQRRLRDAERVLEESLPFTVARDIPICNHWQTAVRCRLRFLEGRWSAALEDADDVLNRVGMPLATLWPHLVSALVPLRRTGSVTHHFDAAWDIAERLDEPLRRLPVLSAFAERMWLTATPDERVTALTRVEVQPATAWAAGDLAVWLWRLGLDVAVDTDSVAEPYRLTLIGRHRAAADWWRAAGAVFEEAMASVDAADVQGIERLDLLGATGVADRLRVSSETCTLMYSGVHDDADCQRGPSCTPRVAQPCRRRRGDHHYQARTSSGGAGPTGRSSNSPRGTGPSRRRGDPSGPFHRPEHALTGYRWDGR
jgi:hypothetical protein